MTKAVAWINDSWGSLSTLSVPLDDSGLRLGDGIFETIMILNGEAKLLEEHLDRWAKNAKILHMKSPPSKEWLKPLIQQGINKAGIDRGNGSIRLNWSRGSRKYRGININTQENNSSNCRFWLEIHPGEPVFQPISTMISQTEMRNSKSLVSSCKTFNYSQSIQVKIEAQIAGFDDALLLNTNDEMCCGSTSNLIIKRKGIYLTPRIQSGCLPGIMRQKALELGIIKEEKIYARPEEGDEWLLINSLSCKPIKLINNTALQVLVNPRVLWESILCN